MKTHAYTGETEKLSMFPSSAIATNFTKPKPNSVHILQFSDKIL